MTLSIISFTLGPLENNTYLLVTDDLHAAIIDPPLGSESIARYIKENGLVLDYILLTHAHFDHIAGINTLAAICQTPPRVFLHPADMPLWQDHGLASTFGIDLELTLEPDAQLSSQSIINFGNCKIEVRHAPGHSPGHTIFYLPDLKFALCGDVIFNNGIGRTDLPGGNYTELMKSIDEQIFTLPPETILYPGHGPKTSVADEKLRNPFFN